MKSKLKRGCRCTSVHFSGYCLKKNTTVEGDLGYDYSKGTLYYEELRTHLSFCNMNNKMYRMGMEIILVHGLKHFLDKFRRKDYRQSNNEIPTGLPTKIHGRTETAGADGELVSLLSVMIQAAGNHNGAKQENHN